MVPCAAAAVLMACLGVPALAEGQAAPPVATSVSVAGDDSLGSLLGGEGERTASLTLTNTGSDVIATLPAAARVAGTDATSAPTAIGPLTQARSASLEVPVTIPALTFGTTDVGVVVGDGSRGINRSASVITYPWLLILVAALVALGLVALVAVRLIRRRSGASEPVPEHGPATPPELPSAPAAAASATVADAGASAATVPPKGLDMASLENDLAEELGRVLAAAGPIGADEPPEPPASSVAAEVAAAVGARHDLAPDAIEALASDLSTSLATELGEGASGAG